MQRFHAQFLPISVNVVNFLPHNSHGIRIDLICVTRCAQVKTHSTSIRRLHTIASTNVCKTANYLQSNRSSLFFSVSFSLCASLIESSMEYARACAFVCASMLRACSIECQAFQFWHLSTRSCVNRFVCLFKCTAPNRVAKWMKSALLASNKQWTHNVGTPSIWRKKLVRVFVGGGTAIVY